MRMKKALTHEEIRKRYCLSKCRDLREFGYTDLTIDEVFEQYDKVVAKDPVLTVIGTIIKDDFEKAATYKI